MGTLDPVDVSDVAEKFVLAAERELSGRYFDLRLAVPEGVLPDTFTSLYQLLVKGTTGRLLSGLFVSVPGQLAPGDSNLGVAYSWLAGKPVALEICAGPSEEVLASRGIAEALARGVALAEKPETVVALACSYCTLAANGDPSSPSNYLCDSVRARADAGPLSVGGQGTAMAFLREMDNDGDYIQGCLFVLLAEDPSGAALASRSWPVNGRDGRELATCLGLYLTRLGISSREITRAENKRLLALSAVMSHAIQGPLARVQVSGKLSRQLDALGVESRPSLTPLRQTVERLEKACQELRDYSGFFVDLGKTEATRSHRTDLRLAVARGAAQASVDEGALQLERLADCPDVDFSLILLTVLLRECFRNAVAEDQGCRFLIDYVVDRESGLVVMTLAQSIDIASEVGALLFRVPIPNHLRSTKADRNSKNVGLAMWAFGEVFREKGLPTPRVSRLSGSEAGGAELEFVFHIHRD